MGAVRSSQLNSTRLGLYLRFLTIVREIADGVIEPARSSIVVAIDNQT